MPTATGLRKKVEQRNSTSRGYKRTYAGAVDGGRPPPPRRVIRFSDQSFNSVPRFLELVADHRASVEADLGSVPLWFRGHRDETWKLKSTLKRHGIQPERAPELAGTAP